ncbi:MAG: Mur ligase family protein, partial [Candidatus Acidiferrum sp.]
MTTGLSGTREEERGEIRADAADSRGIALTADSRSGKKLSALVEGVATTASAPIAQTDIEQVSCDSRRVRPRALFFALRGAKIDGNAFLQDAIAHGAVAIASEDAAPAWLPASVAWVQVREARKALAITGANFYGHAASSLRMAAVTGTNGKTTTTSLIDAMVRASGAKTGLFGTIAYHTPRGEYPSPNTTPESLDLQRFFAEIRDEGGKFAVLEASSHALTMERLWGCHFAAAVFTNLTREHMDYHR